jgi:hypothetical protein
MAFFAVMALLCREDAALPLAIYGLLSLFRRETRLSGAVVAVGSALWFSAAVLWIIPHFAPEGRMANLERWSALGATAPEVAYNMAMHPGRVLSALFSPAVKQLLLPLLFLPLLDPKTVLPLLPPVALCVLSSFSEQAALRGAYPALFIAYLFAGAVRVLAYPGIKEALSRARVCLLVSLALIGFNLRQLPWPESLRGAGAAELGLAALRPALAPQRVLAQGSILPHVGWPKEAEMLGAPGARPFEYYDTILLSSAQNPWPLQEQDVREVEFKLRRSRKWEVRRLGSIVAFQKRERSGRHAPAIVSTCIGEGPILPFSEEIGPCCSVENRPLHPGKV